MNPEIDLYIVSTPRQWWIACALACHFQRPAKMLIDDCFNGADGYAHLTSRWNRSPFESVELLSGKNSWLGLKGGARAWKKFLEPSKRKKQMQGYLLNNVVKMLFTSSVRDWMTQLAVHCQPNLQVSYLDDGIRTYQQDIPKKQSYLKILRKRLAHGFWYHSPQPYSEIDYLSNAYVFHAKMVNSDIRALQVIELQNSWFLEPQMLELAQALLKQHKFESFVRERDNQPNLILVFTKLSILERDCVDFDLDRFKQRLLGVVNKAASDGQVIWVKYHPREVGDDIYGLAKEIPHVHFIPASIPFDVLISLLNNGDSMIGEISTVLFDVALRRPDVKVSSVDCLLGNAKLSAPFQKAGVNMIESFHD